MQHLALAVGNRLAVQKEGIASAQRRKHRSCSLLGVRGARDRVGHVDIGTDLAFFKWPNVQAISYVARIRPDEPFDLVEVLHAACIEELPQALAALGRARSLTNVGVTFSRTYSVLRNDRSYPGTPWKSGGSSKSITGQFGTNV